MTARTRHPVTDRYPVRPGMDADFTASALRDLAADATEPVTVVSPAIVPAAAQARLWQLPGDPAQVTAVQTAAAGSWHPVDRRAGIDLLAAFETSHTLRPPILTRTRRMTPDTALAWLLVARHWTTIALTTRDWRYLNTACKVLGAVWCRRDEASAADQRWHQPDLTSALAALADRVLAATELARHCTPAPSATQDWPRPTPHRPARPHHAAARLAVLAALGSTTAIRFHQEAASSGIPIAGTCWYTGPNSHAADSSYTDAWYPHPQAPASELKPSQVRPDVIADDWAGVTARLRRAAPDVVVLIGMPIVPAHVLSVARLGMINAHNGALPGYRGMDAVGWAMLNGDPVTCTVHQAVTAVDAGDILSSATVATHPLSGLRARVKAMQLCLLLDVAAATTDTGRLPNATAQPAHAGRQWFRMHPHLKRLLDRSLAAYPITAAYPPPNPRN